MTRARYHSLVALVALGSISLSAVSAAAYEFVRTLGSPQNDRYCDAVRTTDGNLVAVGNETLSYYPGVSELLVVKLTPDGNQVWCLTLGSVESDAATCVIETSDAGIVVLGHTETGLGGPGDQIVLAKFTQAGALTWSKVFGSTFSNLQLTGTGMIEDANHELVVTGWVHRNLQNATDLLLAKFTLAGALVSARAYSGTAISHWDRENYGASLVEAGNGDVVVVGHVYDPSEAETDILLGRFSSSLAIRDVQLLNATTAQTTDVANAIVNWQNGGYAVAGVTGAAPFLLLLNQDLGITSGQKRIPGCNGDCSLVRTENDDLVIATGYGANGGNVYVIERTASGQVEYARIGHPTGSEFGAVPVVDAQGALHVFGYSSGWGQGGADCLHVKFDNALETCVEDDGGPIGVQLFQPASAVYAMTSVSLQVYSEDWQFASAATAVGGLICGEAIDLVVQGIAPDAAYQGQNVIFDISIRNVGSVSAPESTAGIRIDGAPSWWTVVTPAIEPGGLVPVTFDMGQYPGGSHEIQACADLGDVVAEVDESNNCATEPIGCLTGAVVFDPPAPARFYLNTSFAVIGDAGFVPSFTGNVLWSLSLSTGLALDPDGLVLAGPASGVAGFSGSRLALGVHPNVLVADATDPANLANVGSIAGIYGNTNIAVDPDGIIGYTAAHWGPGLGRLWSFNTATVAREDPDGLDFSGEPGSIAVGGDAVAITDMSDGGLIIVDVSNPANMVVRGSIDLPAPATYYSNNNIVFAEDGRTGFVATSERVLYAFDAVNAVLLDPDGVSFGDGGWGIKVATKNGVVGCTWTSQALWRGGLVFVDATDPHNLVIKSEADFGTAVLLQTDANPAFTDDGRGAAVGAKNDRVYSFDVETGEQTSGPFAVDVEPNFVSIFPPNNRVGIACTHATQSSNVWIISGLFPPNTGAPQLAETRDDLLQNQPNPFNPRTVIRYEVRESGNVRLEIFDLRGRRITTLVDADRAAGRHEVTWEASGMTSGVYCYRLVTGGTVLTRTAVLLK